MQITKSVSPSGPSCCFARTCEGRISPALEDFDPSSVSELLPSWVWIQHGPSMSNLLKSIHSEMGTKGEGDPVNTSMHK